MGGVESLPLESGWNQNGWVELNPPAGEWGNQNERVELKIPMLERGGIKTRVKIGRACGANLTEGWSMTSADGSKSGAPAAQI